MTTLADRLDAEYEPTWRPEPGETLEGVVVALNVTTSKFDGVTRYAVVTVLPESAHPLAVHALDEDLALELWKVRPQVGDRITVRYVGLLEPRLKGSPYRGYRLAIVASAGFDWENFDESTSTGGSPAATAGGDDGWPFAKA
jgi:hypothetical protein